MHGKEIFQCHIIHASQSRAFTLEWMYWNLAREDVEGASLRFAA
jgi:hypothetical protein